jgi:hypothetical protein
MAVKDNPALYVDKLYNGKLRIEPEDRVRVTHIKSWVIYFEVIRGVDSSVEHYMLHNCTEDYEDETVLYYREPLLVHGVHHGNYIPHPIIRRAGDSGVSSRYIKYRTPRGNTLSLIDIDYFIHKLALQGFASGVSLEAYISGVKASNHDWEVKCAAYRSAISSLDNLLREARSHIVHVVD